MNRRRCVPPHCAAWGDPRHTGSVLQHVGNHTKGIHVCRLKGVFCLSFHVQAVVSEGHAMVLSILAKTLIMVYEISARGMYHLNTVHVSNWARLPGKNVVHQGISYSFVYRGHHSFFHILMDLIGGCGARIYPIRDLIRSPGCPQWVKFGWKS